MMKITIYELLGMIKDGNAPKKIKFRDTIYEFWKDNEVIDYRFKDEDDCHGYLSTYIGNNYLDSIYEEVEIPEEEKKIPEKLDDFNLTTYSRDDEDLGLELNYTGVSNTFNDVYFKINEIIDYLKSKGE